MIHQPTADNVVEPLREDLIAFISQHTEMLLTKNIKNQILHKSYMYEKKKNTKTTQKTSEIAYDEDLVQISLQ